MSKNVSSQDLLNIFGFVFIILGLGLEGPMSFALLGGAICMFLAGIVIAIARKPDSGDSGKNGGG